MSQIYPVGDHQLSPNLGLGLWGTDEVTTDNFLLIDAAFGSVGGGIKINGSVVTNPNFVNSASVTFGVVGSNISLTASGGGTPGGSPTQLQFNNTGVFGGLPGSSVSPTNGWISLSPTGTGVAFSITAFNAGGDSDILRITSPDIHAQPSAPKLVTRIDQGGALYIRPGILGQPDIQFPASSLTVVADDVVAGDQIVGFYTFDTNPAFTMDNGGDASFYHILTVLGSLGVFGGMRDTNGALGNNGQVLSSTGTQVLWVTPSAGTVSSFSAGTLSPLFTTSVATSTTTPALTFSLSTQANNLVFAGPTSGGPLAPTFRALVSGDIPNLDASKITTGVLALARGGNTFALLGDMIYGGVAAAPTVLSGNITATKMYLSQTGTSSVSAAPAWAQINYADITGTAPTPPSGSVLWSALGNAGGNLTLTNGTNTTEFDQTTNVAWLWKNTTIATVSTTNASPLLEVAANYWTGAASAADTWTIGSSLAAGTNGVSKLTIAHSGSTGLAALDLTSIGANGGSASNAQGILITNSWSISGATGTSGSLAMNGPASGAAVNWYRGGTLAAQFTFASGSNVINTSAAGDYWTLRSNITTQVGANGFGTNFTNQSSFTGTTSTQGGVNIASTFAPTSGTSAFIGLGVNPTINQTSTASGSYTALKVNVVETALLGSTNLLLDLQAGATGGTSEFAISNTGIVKQYGAIATVANGVPSEYATLNLTAQAASIGSTTLYAVPASGAGMYRISYYLDVSTAGTAGTVTVTFGWTDATSSTESKTSASVSLGAVAGGFAQEVITFYSKASVNITYLTTFTIGTGSPQYELRTRLEYLG